MHRFYCQHADFGPKTITITDPDEIHHIKNVLRLKNGAVIQIFNGQNEEADVTIESIQEAGIGVSVQTVRQASAESLKITLACAPPKKDKFAWIIEKCTELGVAKIIPLKTKRGEVIFSVDKIPTKLARFEKVAVNAAKQSQRLTVPVIRPMSELKQVLAQLDPGGLHLFPSLNGHPRHIREVLLKAHSSQPITIFIGPEGDFTPHEVDMALKAGCVPVSLGDTVLKVETAAIAAVSFVKLSFPNASIGNPDMQELGPRLKYSGTTNKSGLTM